VQETELVAALLKLRVALDETNAGGTTAEAGALDIESAKVQVVNLINNFFRDRLTAVPTIKDYMDSLATV
jgi:phage FluMu gp28-like protein